MENDLTRFVVSSKEGFVLFDGTLDNHRDTESDMRALMNFLDHSDPGEYDLNVHHYKEIV